ncbi:hypothetical protein NXX01_26100 [Bacteroides faecis]|uniref:hypothetical protein n=1 Tax=Bacteroides faecis TaxID=674529 RepID=UPI002165B354|nr:hypothetical protein [Bacteroides faecis]MCS2938183.1 hypothetical protein [Bacteroides faecis]
MERQPYRIGERFWGPRFHGSSSQNVVANNSQKLKTLCGTPDNIKDFLMRI